MNAADWPNTESTRSTVIRRRKTPSAYIVNWIRTNTTSAIEWEGDASFDEEGDHHRFFSTQRARRNRLCIRSRVLSLSRSHEFPAGCLRDFRRSCRTLAEILDEGGAVDLSDSRDPRAPELERRVVLSQYLTAIQCSGSLPPQETGLTVQ